MHAELRDRHVSLRLREASAGTAVISVCGRDSPGLLARISGALAAHGLNILAAEVNSGSDGIAIDELRVEQPVPWAALAPDLERAVTSDADVVARLVDLERPSGLGERPAPPVQTRVTADNEASARFTVIDVVARDRPGLLYRLTRALHQLALDIRLARITTEGHTAHDAFYVEWVTGGKLEPPHLERVLERLREAIRAPLGPPPPSKTG